MCVLVNQPFVHVCVSVRVCSYQGRQLDFPLWSWFKKLTIEQARAREGRQYRKRWEKKGRWRKAKRTGERQEKRERPITRIWAQRDKRGNERGWQTGRERELFPLGLWETEERRAWSVYVRSVVQLINLWQEGFLCFVPWIASLIYMVIFFKTLAAYKTLLFPSLLSLKPFLDSLHAYAYSEMHTRVKLNTMWLYVGADMLLGLTFLIRLFHYYSELWDISPYTS